MILDLMCYVFGGGKFIKLFFRRTLVTLCPLFSSISRQGAKGNRKDAMYFFAPLRYLSGFA